jgi:2-C-methyl-D-erythritol 4-phosphate cytidylyltransferase
VSGTPEVGSGPRKYPHPPVGSAAVVVLAGGSGSRVGGSLNKVYLPLAGRRLISWSLVWAGEVAAVGHLVLVVRPEDAELAEQTLSREAPSGPPVEMVIGGDTRHGSEQAALDLLAPRIGSGEVEVVVIHDGARPLAGPALFRTVISTAASVGGAVPALPARGLLPAQAGPDTGGSSPTYRTAGGSSPTYRTAGGPSPIGRTVGGPTASGKTTAGTTAAGETASGIAAGPTGGLARVQTPQAFRAPELLGAYALARTEGYHGTDTACSIEQYGDLAVRVVAGSRHNLKVTYPHDVLLAERLLALNHYRMP